MPLINHNTTLIKYLCVGIMATLIFYISANCCKAIGLQAFVATCIGNVISFVFGYFTQMRWTFKANTKHKIMIPRYIFLLCLILLYGESIILLTHIFHLDSYIPYYLISAFIALSVPLFSYPLQKFWVFSINSQSKKKAIKTKIPMGGGADYKQKNSISYHNPNLKPNLAKFFYFFQSYKLSFFKFYYFFDSSFVYRILIAFIIFFNHHKTFFTSKIFNIYRFCPQSQIIYLSSLLLCFDRSPLFMLTLSLSFHSNRHQNQAHTKEIL